MFCDKKNATFICNDVNAAFAIGRLPRTAEAVQFLYSCCGARNDVYEPTAYRTLKPLNP